MKTGIAFEGTCALCNKTFDRQDGVRLFWTGRDGRPYCSPDHALFQLTSAEEWAKQAERMQ